MSHASHVRRLEVSTDTCYETHAFNREGHDNNGRALLRLGYGIRKTF